MEYLKENWKELLLITGVMVIGCWFILMLSERVVPWSDDPFTPHISVPLK